MVPFIYTKLLLLQDTRDDIIIGSQVWIVDPDSAYIDGSVLSISGKEAEVQTGSEGENKVNSIPY